MSSSGTHLVKFEGCCPDALEAGRLGAAYREGLLKASGTITSVEKAGVTVDGVQSKLS